MSHGQPPPQPRRQIDADDLREPLSSKDVVQSLQSIIEGGEPDKSGRGYVLNLLAESCIEIKRLRAIERRYLWLRPGLAECCEPAVSIEEFERRVDASIEAGHSPQVRMEDGSLRGAVETSDVQGS